VGKNEDLNDTPEMVYRSTEDASVPVETVYTKAGYNKDSSFG